MKIAFIRLDRPLFFTQNVAEDTFRAGLDTQIEELPSGFIRITRGNTCKGVHGSKVTQLDYAAPIAEPKKEAKPAVKAPA